MFFLCFLASDSACVAARFLYQDVSTVLRWYRWGAARDRQEGCIEVDKPVPRRIRRLNRNIDVKHNGVPRSAEVRLIEREVELSQVGKRQREFARVGAPDLVVRDMSAETLFNIEVRSTMGKTKVRQSDDVRSAPGAFLPLKTNGSLLF